MMNDETTQPNSVIPPPPSLEEQQLPRPKRPMPALMIGMVFLCMALFLLYGTIESATMILRGVAAKYLVFLVLQVLVSAFTSGALLVIGIGLICMLRWARQAAVLLLYIIIAIKVYLCFMTPEFTLAPPEQAADDIVHSFWILLFYGFLINRLSLPLMKAAFSIE